METPEAQTTDRPPRIGCYSTARVRGGRVERVERHTQRLRRDALRLGLPEPPPRDIEARLWQAAEAALNGQDGIVRIEWSREPEEGEPVLRTSTRGLGRNPATWRARSAQTPHPGPGDRDHAKAVSIESIDAARAEAVESRVDEVLLFDAQGFLVEGGHSNCLLVDDEGRLRTPALELGAVEGLGLTLIRESGFPLQTGRFDRPTVRAASEIMGVNCVRGVVPIVELDGTQVGHGQPGPWANRLRRYFSA